MAKRFELYFATLTKTLIAYGILDSCFKLRNTGSQVRWIRWSNNNLSGMVQRAVLNGSNSVWRQFKAAVPKGSILRTLLFILFINDIVSDINASIKLFADDTSFCRDS